MGTTQHPYAHILVAIAEGKNERPTYEQLIGKTELARDRDVRFVTI